VSGDASPGGRPGPVARFRELVRANHGTWRGAVRTWLGQAEYLAGRLQPHTRLDPAAVERLVFVCLGNINRSAFAEQVARAAGARCCSIGLSTTTGAPATPEARRTAPGFGFALEEHRATAIADHERRPTDLLVVMEVRHVHRLVAAGVPPSAIVLLGHWAAPRRIHLHDPHTLSDAYFRTCFALIHSGVQGLVAQLREGGSPCLR
jgi:protein-tyrosine phosphatase